MSARDDDEDERNEDFGSGYMCPQCHGVGCRYCGYSGEVDGKDEDPPEIEDDDS